MVSADKVGRRDFGAVFSPGNLRRQVAGQKERNFRDSKSMRPVDFTINVDREVHITKTKEVILNENQHQYQRA